MAYTPPINFSSRLFAKKQTNVIYSFVVAKPMYRIFIFYGNLRYCISTGFLKISIYVICLILKRIENNY